MTAAKRISRRREVVLHLTAEEAESLSEVVDSRIEELRSEIRHTDTDEFRSYLLGVREDLLNIAKRLDNYHAERRFEPEVASL